MVISIVLDGLLAQKGFLKTGIPLEWLVPVWFPLKYQPKGVHFQSLLFRLYAVLISISFSSFFSRYTEHKQKAYVAFYVVAMVLELMLAEVRIFPPEKGASRHPRKKRGAFVKQHAQRGICLRKYATWEWLKIKGFQGKWYIFLSHMSIMFTSVLIRGSGGEMSHNQSPGNRVVRDNPSQKRRGRLYNSLHGSLGSFWSRVLQIFETPPFETANFRRESCCWGGV